MIRMIKKVVRLYSLNSLSVLNIKIFWSINIDIIDHIIPASMFNLKSIYDRDLCYHFTNLQPLWQSDNASKSNKVTKYTIKKITKKFIKTIEKELVWK